MSIEGYVREVGIADSWTSASRSPAPDGFRHVIVDEFERPHSMWARLDKPRSCRWTVGPEHRACGRPAAVVILRGRTRQRWGYCPQHLYGRRWEPPRLLSAILVPADEQP